MKQKLMVLLLCFFCLTAIAQTELSHLVIQSKDGNRITYALTESPKLTFTETELIVSTSAIDTSYPLRNMLTITYGTDFYGGVKNLQNDDISFELMGESLLLHDLSAGSTVQIYSTNGENVLSKKTLHSGDYSFSLTSLSPGLYIVKVNSLTYKIVRK